MGLLISLTAPAWVGILGNRSQSAAADGIGDTLERARAYAMGNNTHVFVGVAEYDASRPPSAALQTAGIGRVVIVTVASRDGTPHYDVANQLWTGDGTTLVAISKPLVFENIHLADYTPTPGTQTPPMTGKGSMLRPIYTPNYGVGSSQFASSTTFNYPLTGTVRYRFSKVIDFDSKGVARVINFNTPNTDVIPATIEIDLQLTHGNSTPAAPSDTAPLNYVAVQCDGVTGTIRVFR